MTEPEQKPDYLKQVVLPERNKFMKVIENFILTVEATGGVFCNRKGLYEPVGDREWIDLGDVYVEACRAIGHEPMIVDDPDEDERGEYEEEDEVDD